MSKRAVNLLRKMAVPVLHNAANPLKGTRLDIITVSATSKTLTAAESGARVVWAGGSAATVTLPSVASGLYFEVFASTAQAHVLNGGDSVMSGVAYDNSNDSDDANIDRLAINAGSSITLANAAIGDSVRVWSDGTSWFVKGWFNDTPTVA